MMELKLQMRRLKFEQERELQEREQRLKELEMQLQYQERREREERELAREERHYRMELRKLVLQASQTHPVDAPRYSGSVFRVESAVKLIPRFNENDAETFLIAFEKIAQLNNFQRTNTLRSCKSTSRGKR